MAANFPISKLTIDDLVDIAQITSDPSVAGYVANIGSLLLQTTGQLWIKVGALDSEWNKFSAGPAAGRDQIVSTGIISGGALSINADPTKFDIEAGIGIIVDNYTDTLNPSAKLVSWGTMTAVTITNLATSTRSFISIDIDGFVVQQPEPGYSNSDHKNNIILGNIGHANFTSIIGLRSSPDPALDATARLADLARALGSFNVTGNDYSANGVNLNINKNSGVTYRLGNNFENNLRDVDTNTDDAETTALFNYSYRDGGGSYTVTAPATTIDPANYDDGSGTLVSVPTNDWQIQIIRYFSGITGVTSTRIEYGQTTFATKEAALNILPDPAHLQNPAFGEGVIRAYLVIKETATDLSDLAQAQFVQAAKFGGGGGGEASGAITTLQQSYDNSVTPEIITNSTLGALTIGEGPAVGGNILECIDDVAATVFAITVDGSLPNTSIDNLNDMALSTIVGSPSPAQDQTILTTPDSVRIKSLSLETEVYQFSATTLVPDAYLAIGNATDPLTGVGMPLHGTIVRVAGHCSDTGGNTKGIDLYLNADVGSTATLGTISGAGEQTFADNTLNIDVAAGDKIRLRASADVGTIQDTIITLYIKWRA